MKQGYFKRILILYLWLGLLGCTDINDSLGVQPKKITTSPYAEDIGFTLVEPVNNSFDVETSFQISGEVNNYSHMDFPHLWVVAEHKSGSEDSFNYYVTIEDGKFSDTIVLPYGLGDYDISLRAPYDEQTYYDVANFSVNNVEDVRQQMAEYTLFGLEKDLQLTNIEVTDGIVYVTGHLANTYTDDKVLIEVRKDLEEKQIVTPVRDYSFNEQIPLYFGEGNYEIHVQLHHEVDDYYYTSGILRLNNDVTKQFAQIETYADYLTSGVILEHPTRKELHELSEQTYKIAGEIDSTIAADPSIEHIIVMLTYLDEDLEAGYIIPVIDNHFSDDVYFRFGPGTYEVKINIPDLEKSDQSMFYYRTIASITHEVVQVPDERDLLPSRGIESKHPTIINTAEEITAGLTTDREKAKAIYEFVAKNVSYDVKKAEADLFNVSDSALTTLQAKSGICQDYAFLATALLRAIGIEAHYVSGYAGERHAWVEAKVDGEWIEMDPTWGAGYVYDGQFYFQYNEQFFDPAPNFLQQTHTREQIMY